MKTNNPALDKSLPSFQARILALAACAFLTGCAGGSRTSTAQEPLVAGGTGAASSDLTLVYGDPLGPHAGNSSLFRSAVASAGSAAEYAFSSPLLLPDDFNDQRRLFLVWPEIYLAAAIESATYTYVMEDSLGKMVARSAIFSAILDPEQHRFSVDLFNLLAPYADSLVVGQKQWVQVDLSQAGGQHRRFRVSLRVQGALPALAHQEIPATSLGDWPSFRQSIAEPATLSQDVFNNPTDRALTLWVSTLSGDAQMQWYLNAPEHVIDGWAENCWDHTFRQVDHPFRSVLHLTPMQVNAWRRLELPAHGSVTINWQFQALPSYGQCPLPGPTLRHYSWDNYKPNCPDNHFGDGQTYVWVGGTRIRDFLDAYEVRGAQVDSSLVRTVWLSDPDVTQTQFLVAIAESADHEPSVTLLRPLLVGDTLKGSQAVGDFGYFSPSALAAAPDLACVGYY